MDGKNLRRLDIERPIAKPEFPLPVIFSPSRAADWPTKRRNENAEIRERAHFFVKEFDKNGRPIYGFVITREPTDHRSDN